MNAARFLTESRRMVRPVSAVNDPSTGPTETRVLRYTMPISLAALAALLLFAWWLLAL